MSINKLIKSGAYTFALVSLVPTIGYFIHPRPPWNYYLLILPLIAAALAPVLAISGGLGAVLGFRTRVWPAFAMGLLGAGISLLVILQTAGKHRVLDNSFGTEAVSIAREETMRRAGREQEPALRADMAFAVVPGTDRKLLCDIWEPAPGVERSGISVIFLHGGAWYLSDKDVGTRNFFHQLTSRGHLVMDVAYRLAPEVDMQTMVGDVQRAVVWMKDHAARYGTDPGRIVLAGASSGGHLALMAAYTPGDSRLTPPDLQDRNLSVRAVVSLYGPADLVACYDYWDQERTLNLPPVEIGAPGAATAEKTMENAGRLDILLGGHLNQVPEKYALLSPVNHVHLDAPPTFLYQGRRDVIASLGSTRDLEGRLKAAGIPVASIEVPWINHAFDLIFPKMSPAAQAMFRDVLVFLELVK